MRMIIASSVAGAVAAAAGWAAAQPATSTSSTTFRRAAQVRLADTQVTRLELSQAKLRPTALALRTSLAQTAATRIDLAAVDRTTLPVLVAARPSLIPNLRIFPRAAFFTASASEPGMTLVIDGSKTATVAPPRFKMPNTMILRPQALSVAPAAASTTLRREALSAQPRSFSAATALRPGAAREATTRQPPPAAPAAPPPTLQNVVIERTEYGLDISFVRFGAVYNLAIACDAPETDPRCSEEGAKALAGQLEVIGGGGAPQ